MFYFHVSSIKELEKVLVKHYAPNHMPDPKEEWSLLENIDGSSVSLLNP